MTAAMLHESIWFEKSKYDEAESHYQRFLARTIAHATPQDKTEGFSQQTKQGSVKSKASSFSPVEEIAKARKKIQQTLSMAPTSNVGGEDARITQLEEENKKLKVVTEELRTSLQNLILRVEQLEKGKKTEAGNHTSAKEEAPAQEKNDDDDDDDFNLFGSDDDEYEKEEAPAQEKNDDDDDDDFNLFGSDDDEYEDEDEKKKAALEAYAAKKSKKPAVIAKSSIVLDVKPWDDETDMKELEKCVRSIECDGLLWGASKLLDVAFGIKKLQISCVVEDDKVGTDFLEEKITEFEDFVQSVDIAAFNKI